MDITTGLEFYALGALISALLFIIAYCRETINYYRNEKKNMIEIYGHSNVTIFEYFDKNVFLYGLIVFTLASFLGAILLLLNMLGIIDAYRK